MAQADRSVTLHEEVYYALDNSGLIELLEEFGPRLARMPADFVLPAYDLELQRRDKLISSLEEARNRLWNGSIHRESLQAAEATRNELIANVVGSDTRSPDKDNGDATFSSRWAGPSLRILAGSGLAIANAAVGVTAGLAATIATIGATTVPTYVGVLTSIYTGLTQAADGLEKISRSK